MENQTIRLKKRPRCKKGTRRNRKTNLCEESSASAASISYKFCPLKTVNSSLKKLYTVIQNIPLNTPQNMKKYLETIYSTLKEKKNYLRLQNAECITMYNFYNFLLKNKSMQKYENQAIDQIKSNDILTLKVPFVFGDYHYMVAVISITRKKVNIYQSYGSSVKLFEIKNLDFNLFIQMLYNCQKINNEPANYIHHMKLLKEISYILYRIPNIECIWYRDDFVPEYDYSDHVEFDDDANAEEQREKRREKRLGFSDYSSETIKRNYQLMKERGNNFNMTIWRAPTKEDKEE